MKLKAKMLLASLLILLPVTEAFGCLCKVRTLSKRKKSSDAVFVGKVTSVEDRDKELQVTLKVSQVWKGTEQSEITVFTGGGCAKWFEVEKEYLVFATKDQATEELKTGMCSGTSSLENAKKDITSLGKSKFQRGY